jgi:hypothetical protein
MCSILKAEIEIIAERSLRDFSPEAFGNPYGIDVRVLCP